MGHWFSVAGYLAMFVPLLTLIAGHAVGFSWAPVVLFFAVYPVIRLVTGEVGETQREWTELGAKVLGALPIAYAICFVATYAWVMHVLSEAELKSISEKVGFALGLMVTVALASCVAHALAHSRQKSERRLGSFMMALYGYPFFRAEHMAHHAMPRHVEAGHCPAVEESMMGFALRRLWKVPKEAIEWSAGVMARSERQSMMDSIWFGCAVSAASLVALTWAGGLYGAVVFMVVAIGLQMINSFVGYLQHWGLGIDNGVQGGVRVQVGWEDRCRMQALTTLNLSLHQHHHERPSTPYFRLEPRRAGPLLPGGYGIMLLIGFVPPLWRKSMLPRLEAWKNDPHGQVGAGNALYCVSVTKQMQRAETSQ
jgi:alkane 1-monooxygenase